MSYRATALILASAVFLASPAAAAAQEPPATSHIRGRVLSPQGSPVSDVRVCARPLNGLRGRLPCESSDAAGNFSIPVAPGETYFMTAGKEADGYADTASPFYRVPFASLPEVIVPEGQAPPEVTFHLAYPAGRLALRVADAETGLPVERARVRLCRLETPRYCSSFIPAVVAGLHRLLVPPAPVSVEVSAEGYEAWHAGEPVRLTGGAEGELG
ncbi:MAG TPA: carboxypeptidase-like regulatory domain-containing protein, partial [Pyrinomonadaceae bacterium]|nr:carboxypeptidase-like regulatory domain-containing protein [Pyrinomonadaceae bacterium]